MRTRWVGATALLLECGDADEVEAWRAEAWRRREHGFTVVDIVPGELSVLLDGVEPGCSLADWAPRPVVAPRAGDVVRIPTVFDGDDLAAVADRWAVSMPDAVDRLTGTTLRVAFCGFAPGFAYLRGFPAAWAVPRLAAPRSRVPAGSVALAGAYAGIYPTASPGGWQLVGRTEQPLFDVRREPPALLSPGTSVRLVAA